MTAVQPGAAAKNIDARPKRPRSRLTGERFPLPRPMWFIIPGTTAICWIRYGRKVLRERESGSQSRSARCIAETERRTLPLRKSVLSTAMQRMRTVFGKTAVSKHSGSITMTTAWER